MAAIKSYKGFDKNLKCRDFQYEIGKEYEMDGEIKVCNRGFHACESPFDVFDHYTMIDSRFCEVEQDGNISKEDRGTKIGSSGYGAKIDSTGEDCVIMCAGINSVAKASKGSWITLSEWSYSDKKQRYIPVCVKTEFVDGEKIKADTYYKLDGGVFKEIQ